MQTKIKTIRLSIIILLFTDNIVKLMILPKSNFYSTEKTSEHKNLIYFANERKECLFSYVK